MRSSILLLISCCAGVLMSTGVVMADGSSPTNRLGLPGLASTVSAPERKIAPMRLGMHYRGGTFDTEHGIATDLSTRDVTSRAVRGILQLKAAPNMVLAISWPYRFLSDNGGASVSGFGDLELSGTARLFEFGRTTFGAWGSLRTPTGESSQGLGTGSIEGEYGATVTSLFFVDSPAPEMLWHFNLGYRVNKNESEGYGASDGALRESGAFFPAYPATPPNTGSTENDELLIRTALEFRRRWGHLFLEASMDWLAWYDGAVFGESASWITPGVFIGGEAGPALTASWSVGLFKDDSDTAYEPRLPDSYVELGLSMPIFLGGRDRDNDGVPDRDDGCIDQPEDLDGYEDEDGCPDTDNDGDGVLDRYDLAPNLPEDFDGFEDADGRPDLDNDLDGIPDTEDECPQRPEDFDGFEDDDGCPDIILDADGDGILDDVDACPTEPEDLDGFEDSDGCPDTDNDLDGIPDVDDECPGEPEDYDGDRDEDGCPDLEEAEG